MKILLITPTSQQVVGFRKNLIEHLQENNFEVSVLTFDEAYKQTIIERNIEFHCVVDKNRSLNLIKILTLKNKYCAEIKKINPDIVFTFMLKPNIFGTRAAKQAGVNKIFSMVEGAGDVFINNGLKWKIIRSVVCKMYRKSFKYANKVFFLNNDDKMEFVQKGLVKEDKCEIIHGIGVDTEHFAYKPIKNHRTFLMIARMLKTKGVYEYCKCARIVKQKYPDAVFNYLGAEGTVKLSDIQEYIDDGSINYLGTTKDVRPYLEDTLLLLLSSYREGMPMSIMEAEAVGRGIITSDGIGCKDTVEDEYNGFVVPHDDYKQMAEKVIWCIEHPEEAEQMGKNARIFAEENFEQKKINEFIVKVIKENEQSVSIDYYTRV